MKSGGAFRKEIKASKRIFLVYFVNSSLKTTFYTVQIYHGSYTFNF